MIDLTDEVLFELMTLEAEAKLLEHRIQDIKMACKEKGSFATERFVCAVLEQKRVGAAPLAQMIQVFGVGALEAAGLIKTSEFKVVKVSPKAEYDGLF